MTVEPLDRDLLPSEARELVDSIRIDITDVGERIATAYLGRAWIGLGYQSWDELCDAEFEGARLRVPREVRAGLVQSLAEAGLSTRSAAKALGVSNATVARDLAGVADVTADRTVVGQDGKRYAPTQPPRPQTPAQSTPSDAAFVKVATTTEEFIAQRDTGEVLSVEDWTARETPSMADIVDERLPHAAADRARLELRARVSRDLKALADLNLTNPAAVAAAVGSDPVLAAWRVAFRQHAQWVKSLEDALAPGLRIVNGDAQ